MSQRKLKKSLMKHAGIPTKVTIPVRNEHGKVIGIRKHNQMCDFKIRSK